MRTPPMLRRTTPTEIDTAPRIFVCSNGGAQDAASPSSARPVGRFVRAAEPTAAGLEQLGYRVERKTGSITPPGTFGRDEWAEHGYPM